MFGLPESVIPKESIDTSQWMFLRESNLFLASARSGIMILIDILKPPNVWMPSYLCPTMLVGIDQKKTTRRFYEVDHDLRISFREWAEQIQVDDIVVFIDYFGFPLDPDIVHSMKERGAWILEDACQALLSKHVGQHSDFALFSLRKFIGVPDGGILVSNCDVKFESIDLEPAPASWWLKMLEASIGRREFDRSGEERRWFDLFREAEDSVPCARYTMSDLSKALLHTNFDYSCIAERRRDNYALLSQELSEMALFPTLPDDVVPLGFPIIHPQRNCIRERLFRKEIFPPVHWPIHEIVPDEFAESHRLAETIMTLPCDQRYSEDDMRGMARNLKSIIDEYTGV